MPAALAEHSATHDHALDFDEDGWFCLTCEDYGLSCVTEQEPVAAAAAATATYHEAWIRFVEAMQPVIERMNDLAVKLKPLLDKLAPVAANKHGHASTCPRHGPTKGGLCRRCAR